MSRGELKQQVKLAMKKNWGVMLLVLILQSAIATVVGLLTCGVGTVLVTGPLLLGVYIVYDEVLKAPAGEKAGDWKHVFNGFKENFGDAFLVGMILEIITAIPVFFSFISIINSLKSLYMMNMMNPYSSYGGFGDTYGGAYGTDMYTTSVSTGSPVWSIITLIVSIVVLYFLLSFAMSMFLLMREPELSAVEALKKSRRLMKGNIFKYILFVLSFLGWFILCIFIFPIIWVEPYYMGSKLMFFDSIYQKAGGGDGAAQQDGPVGGNGPEGTAAAGFAAAGTAAVGAVDASQDAFKAPEAVVEPAEAVVEQAVFDAFKAPEAETEAAEEVAEVVEEVADESGEEAPMFEPFKAPEEPLEGLQPTEKLATDETISLSDLFATEAAEEPKSAEQTPMDERVTLTELFAAKVDAAEEKVEEASPEAVPEIDEEAFKPASIPADFRPEDAAEEVVEEAPAFEPFKASPMEDAPVFEPIQEPEAPAFEPFKEPEVAVEEAPEFVGFKTAEEPVVEEEPEFVGFKTEEVAPVEEAEFVGFKTPEAPAPEEDFAAMASAAFQEAEPAEVADDIFRAADPAPVADSFEPMETIAEAPAPAVEELSPLKCKSCGADLPELMNFCWRCGAKQR